MYVLYVALYWSPGVTHNLCLLEWDETQRKPFCECNEQIWDDEKSDDVKGRLFNFLRVLLRTLTYYERSDK